MGEINYLSENTLHAVPNAIIDTFHFPPAYYYPKSAVDKQLVQKKEDLPSAICMAAEYPLWSNYYFF
ncbi:hypothetical protein [Paenibacillus sp. P32E]|uniref:hypothetical protein n=1 Tax=Paenibacillus sp. P32E TaxID=1349434 RepID=UPI0015B91F98|nr:hypothetical protein [Paenibacillus sp. P32E]